MYLRNSTPDNPFYVFDSEGRTYIYLYTDKSFYVVLERGSEESFLRKGVVNGVKFLDKVYNYSTRDGINNPPSFIDKLIEETNEKKKQLKIAHDINVEKSKIYYSALNNLVTELNKELNKINLSFSNVVTDSVSNGYACYKSNIRFNSNHRDIAIYCFGKCEKHIKGISTYSDNYEITIVGFGNRKIIKKTDDCFEYLKEEITKHLMNR
jgi:hypothetical protein